MCAFSIEQHHIHKDSGIHYMYQLHCHQHGGGLDDPDVDRHQTQTSHLVDTAVMVVDTFVAVGSH